MSKESAKNWFIKKVSKEVFFIYAITWGVLFILEMLKEGVVSNYISLPHTAVFLVALGIAALSFQSPETSLEGAKSLSKQEKIVLAVVSIIVAILIPLIIKASVFLTIVLIFATLGAIWFGTLIFKDV